MPTRWYCLPLFSVNYFCRFRQLFLPVHPLLFSVNYFCRFRQLFLPVHPLFLTALLGHSGAVAGDVEFKDDRVVVLPVDCSSPV